MGRRRRWSEDEKLRIVLESLQAPRQAVSPRCCRTSRVHYFSSGDDHFEPSVVRATILFQLIGFQALDQVQLAQCTWTSRGRQISFVLCTIAARRVTRPAPAGVGPFFKWSGGWSLQLAESGYWLSGRCEGLSPLTWALAALVPE
jgi:hypothetical protein